MWLYGASVLFAIVPYTYAFMMKTNNYMNTILKKTVAEEVEVS